MVRDGWMVEDVGRGVKLLGLLFRFIGALSAVLVGIYCRFGIVRDCAS